MACAPSEDSDQPGHPPSLISHRCPHEEILGPKLPIQRKVNTLIRLGGCPGWYGSSLGTLALLLVLSLGDLQLKDIRIWNSCKVRLENSVMRINVWHQEACRVMPNSYSKWRNFHWTIIILWILFSCIHFLQQIAFKLKYVLLYEL